MKKRKIKKIVDAVFANLDREYDLIYVEHDDKLSDDRIARWLRATEQERYDVENEVYDVFDESRYLSHRDALKEAVENGLRDLGLDDEIDAESFIDEHEDDLDRVKDEIYARDKSNPWKDLLRNTPSQLVRCDLGDVDVPSAWASDDDARTESIETMAEALGVDLEANRANLEELFDNAGGGYLQAIWYADLDDLTRPDENGNPPTRATLTNCYVLVIDTLNGSGHDVKINGAITVDLTNLVLDKDSFGYGWDEIAGVVRSAYEPDNAVYHYPVSLRKKAA